MTGEVEPGHPTDAFCDRYRPDPDAEATPAPEPRPSASTRLVAWLLYGGAGASSRCMAETIGVAAKLFPPGLEPPERPFAPTPADGGDFRRCVDLLDAVPELRKHLHAMSSRSPAWKLYVERWDRLEGLHREGNSSANELYHRVAAMRAAYAEKIKGVT